jgi:hypothetical protein
MKQPDMLAVVASCRKMKMGHGMWEDIKRVNDILKKIYLLTVAENGKRAAGKEKHV